MRLSKLSPFFFSAAVLMHGAITGSAATTDPVGAMQVDLQPGFTIFSPTFVHSNAFQGALGGIAGNTLTLAGLTANAYNTGYYIEFTNDTDGGDGIDTEGVVLDIDNNTENEVVVIGNVAGINGDENVIIRKHVTLDDIFDEATGLTSFTDSFTFYVDGSVFAYTPDGSGNWYNLDTLSIENDVPIYPGTGVAVFLNNPVTTTIYGSVKVTPTQVSIYGGATPNLIGFMHPAGAFDIENSSLANLEAFTDSITDYSNDGNLSLVGSYTYGGGTLYDLNTLNPTTVTVDDVDGLVIIAPNNDSTIKIPAVSVSP